MQNRLEVTANQPVSPESQKPDSILNKLREHLTNNPNLHVAGELAKYDWNRDYHEFLIAPKNPSLDLTELTAIADSIAQVSPDAFKEMGFRRNAYEQSDGTVQLSDISFQEQVGTIRTRTDTTTTITLFDSHIKGVASSKEGHISEDEQAIIQRTSVRIYPDSSLADLLYKGIIDQEKGEANATPLSKELVSTWHTHQLKPDFAKQMRQDLAQANHNPNPKV